MNRQGRKQRALLEQEKGAHARTQEWLDRFQGEVAKRDVEILELRAERDRLVKQIDMMRVGARVLWDVAGEPIEELHDDMGCDQGPDCVCPTNVLVGIAMNDQPVVESALREKLPVIETALANAARRLAGVPDAQCPRCGQSVPDYDGFGVLAHTKPAYSDGCGYCSHPTRMDGVCGICGNVEQEQQA